MQIENYDQLSQTTLHEEARKRGIPVSQLLEQLVADGLVDEYVSDPFVSIYRYNKQDEVYEMRFDSAQQPDPALINQVKLDLARNYEFAARDAMISRMQHHSVRTDSSLTEQEARSRYIERLKKNSRGR